MKYKTKVWGDFYEVDSNTWSMKVEQNSQAIKPGVDRIIELTKDDMQIMLDHFKGVNRIYKPIGLLFWTDCKNGKAKNWKLI